MHEFSPKFAAQTATARARLASLGLPNEVLFPHDSHVFSVFMEWLMLAIGTVC